MPTPMLNKNGQVNPLMLVLLLLGIILLIAGLIATA